ncbi:MAG: hypothetical protein IJW14_02910 [Oscillospiraceae bacterium]|nr:hypothetical protein [Oscillospiraceae bacterium]
MEKYLEAELEVIHFLMEDVIATSSGLPTVPDELPTDPDELPLVPV